VPKHHAHHASTRARKAALTCRERAAHTSGPSCARVALRAASGNRAMSGPNARGHALAELKAARHRHAGADTAQAGHAEVGGTGHAEAGGPLGPRAGRGCVGRHGGIVAGRGAAGAGAGSGVGRTPWPRAGGERAGGAPRHATAPRRVARRGSEQGERAGAGEAEPHHGRSRGRAGAPWPVRPGRATTPGQRAARARGGGGVEPGRACRDGRPEATRRGQAAMAGERGGRGREGATPG
jgi:hypothetical protein